MEVRVTIKTRPGRPWLAITLTAAMLLGTIALAWWVSAWKLSRGFDLADPVAIDPPLLQLCPPAGWEVDPERAASGPVTQLVQFVDVASEATMGRRLALYHIASPPIDGRDLLGRIIRLLGRSQGQILVDAEPTRIGPLPAQQSVVTVQMNVQGHTFVQKHILRVANLGHEHYLVMQLACYGPPTPAELRLMDQVSESVTLNGSYYLPPDDVTESLGIDLGDQGPRWLAVRSGDTDEGLHLLLRADGQEAPAWGEVQLAVAPVPESEDLGELMADHAAAGLGGLDVDQPGLTWPAGLYAPPHAVEPPPPVEKHTVHSIDTWMLRWQGQGSRPIVQLTWLFHPAELAGTPREDRAVWLRAWTTPADEARVVEQAERLITSLRLPDRFATPVDLGVADARGGEFVQQLEQMPSEKLAGFFLPLAGKMGYSARRVGAGGPLLAQALLAGGSERYGQAQALRTTGGWVQRLYRGDTDIGTAPADRWIVTQWNYIAAERTFVQDLDLKVDGQSTVTSSMQVGPQTVSMRVRGRGEDREKSLDRPGNFLPHPLLQAAGGWLVQSQGRSLALNTDGRDTSGPLARFRLAGPRGERLAAVRMQVRHQVNRQLWQVAIWFDYDPDPILLIVGEEGRRAIFRHGQVQWAPVPDAGLGGIEQFLNLRR